MSRPLPSGVERVGVVGTGVIGAGWAAHFLRQGMDVIAWDPAPDAPAKLARTLDQVWPTMERLGLKPGASRDRITVANSLAALADEAQVVQESAPENLEVKIDLLAELDAAAPPEVVLISSTSGFAMSDMQVRCRHPGRTVVGHPFNPPYLMPLVEVVGGARSDPEVVYWAVAFYQSIDRRALRMARELPGFVANRLQEARWRGGARRCTWWRRARPPSKRSTPRSSMDLACAGPSWGLASPFTSPAARAAWRTLDHFGPALLEPWTRLEAPELTPDLRDRMVAGCEDEAGARSVADLIMALWGRWPRAAAAGAAASLSSGRVYRLILSAHWLSPRRGFEVGEGGMAHMLGEAASAGGTGRRSGQAEALLEPRAGRRAGFSLRVANRGARRGHLALRVPGIAQRRASASRPRCAGRGGTALASGALAGGRSPPGELDLVHA